MVVVTRRSVHMHSSGESLCMDGEALLSLIPAIYTAWRVTSNLGRRPGRAARTR